ncbi:MAG: cytoplasmic protein [Deltaproteobacteria bacterium]|nr:cytoplasmic protein [Deltaproteobacteria bacterium]
MEESFKNFQATLLYCNNCRRAMPVRERLLLVLPEGNRYDYTCQGCGSSVGSKSDKDPSNRIITGPAGRSS